MSVRSYDVDATGVHTSAAEAATWSGRHVAGLTGRKDLDWDTPAVQSFTSASI